jgi:predicted nuclease of predicted toxin-antitoxin system
LRLLLDEMYSVEIADELVARGHDVVSVHRTPGRATPDDEVLDHARADERAVVTENIADFRPLAEALLLAGESHAGVIFTTQKRWPRSDPGSIITALDELLTARSEQPTDLELWL